MVVLKRSDDLSNCDALSISSNFKPKTRSDPPVCLRHPHDGADDAVVAAAAKQVAGERVANLGLVGCGLRLSRSAATMIMSLAQ
jgi:hypothetical protein